MSIIVNNKLSNKGIIFYLDSLNKRCYSGTGTKVNDLSSNSISLTTKNITWLESSGFTHTSGTFSYLSTDNSDNTLSDRISISAWIKCSKNSDFQTIIGDNSQNVTTPFIWIYRSNSNSDDLYFQYQDSSATWGSVSSPNFFTGYDDVWVNLTLVIDYVMGVLKVYRNGYQFGSNIALSGTISPNLTNSYFKKLYIGSYDSERHWIRGSISRLIIWNKLLTSSEVLSNYSSIDMNGYYLSKL